MADAQAIANRVHLMRTRHAARDKDYKNILAIRRGDYETVAPGLFNTAEFDKPLIANLIDTTARDIAEVMAPLPAINCETATLSNDADAKRQDMRAAIANSYSQKSRLQDQMFGGADRYGSFGFMAMIVEPDFHDKMPVIRVEDVPTAYYLKDYRGRVKEYFAVYKVTVDALRMQFPNANLYETFLARYGDTRGDRLVDVVRWYADNEQCLMLLDPAIVLVSVQNYTSCCPVRVVERPTITEGTRGQFDDVIWVQIARALVQVYTMNALEQSVHSPIAVPKDVDSIEMGPFAVLQSDNPNQIGRVPLNLSPGLFPEFSSLAQEQRMGSRYPEGRSGSIDASVITGQGVQALMGTFDTQVQTFQRLFSSALEDVIAMCFEMDERAPWANEKQSRIIKDNGAPRKIDYTPTKDIAGNHTVDVSYGAIAGLDPNRALVFTLQALAGGLISKQTAQKSLPVDMNPLAEMRQIQLEQLDDAIAAAMAQLPLAIPQMTMGGADPRQIVLQITKVRELTQKGKSPAEAIAEVFAPEQPDEEAAEPPSPLEQAQGAGAGPAGLPGAGGGGASDLLMSLAGMTPSGNANLQSNVSRMRPVQH